MVTTVSRISVAIASISFVLVKPRRLVISRPLKMLRLIDIVGTRAASWRIVSTPSSSVTERSTSGCSLPSQE
ncbi:hypothetical protein MT350_06290 [Rathayibacter sp. VKM Ac-2928]|nr:hypothetical protein [Rathayibacter sp. VKM Ac-2928]